MSRIGFLFVLVCLWSRSVNAYCDKPTFYVYFANGMFVSREYAAFKAYKAISDENRSQDHGAYTVVYSHGQIAYNTNENILNQLLEVARQKSSDIEMNFWRYLSKQNEAPLWFHELIAYIHRTYIIDEFLKNQDLREQVAVYKKILRKSPSNHILTVAHSQGNLFTNFAFEILAANQADSLRLNMVSVATPASEVFDQGDHITLKSDCVIRPIPTALPSNTTNEGSGACDHGFVEHYMKLGSKSYSRIQMAINRALDASTSPPPNTYGRRVSLSIDLKRFMRWYSRLGTQINKLELKPHQCLGIRLIYHLADDWWRSDPCEMLGLKGVKRTLDDCASEKRKLWPEDGRCPNFFDDTPSVMSSADAPLLDYHHPECSWEKSYFLREVLSPELAKAALNFIKNPNKEIPIQYTGE